MSRSEEQTQNQNYEPIDITVFFEDFFKILRRKWLFLVMAVILGAAGYALVKNHTYVPYFTASSTYAITTSADSQNTDSYYDDALAMQMSKTFPYILTSDIFRSQVGAELGTGYVPGQIRVSVMENTNFLTISVTDTDPQRAYQTLQAVLKTAPELTESVVGKIYMELMDESSLPAVADNPKNLKADALKGGMAGGFAGVCLLILLAFTNRTIRREEDCLKRINTKCLGSVPRVKLKVRSKKVEQHLNILKKNPDPDLVEAFRIIRNKLERRAGQNHIQTILVTSTLPGEGKSTIAVNMALSLAQTGKRVALIDCDLRNPSDRAILDAPEGPGLIDFLKGNAKIAECIVSGQELQRKGLPLLFLRGGNAVKDASGYLSRDWMKKLVLTLKQQVDYVILDVGPVGLMTDASILAQYAEGAVFVVKKDFTKVDKILEAMEQLADSEIEMLGCILNDDN